MYLSACEFVGMAGQAGLAPSLANCPNQIACQAGPAPIDETPLSNANALHELSRANSGEGGREKARAAAQAAGVRERRGSQIDSKLEPKWIRN